MYRVFMAIPCTPSPDSVMETEDDALRQSHSAPPNASATAAVSSTGRPLSADEKLLGGVGNGSTSRRLSFSNESIMAIGDYFRPFSCPGNVRLPQAPPLAQSLTPMEVSPPPTPISHTGANCLLHYPIPRVPGASVGPPGGPAFGGVAAADGHVISAGGPAAGHGSGPGPTAAPTTFGSGPTAAPANSNLDFLFASSAGSVFLRPFNSLPNHHFDAGPSPGRAFVPKHNKPTPDGVADPEPQAMMIVS
jgi:hypothetical protein